MALCSFRRRLLLGEPILHVECHREVGPALDARYTHTPGRGRGEILGFVAFGGREAGRRLLVLVCTNSAAARIEQEVEPWPRTRFTRLTEHRRNFWDDTPEELIRDWRPLEIVVVDTREQLIGLVQGYGWSNIIWRKVPNRTWRRRMSGFVESTMVVVDIDEMGDRCEGDLVRICEDLGCPYLVITSKTPGRYRVLLWTERSMRTLAEHTATHGRYVELFGGDASCKDGTDWYRPCRSRYLRHDGQWQLNPDSGRVVGFKSDGRPLPIETPTNTPLPTTNIINTGARIVPAGDSGGLAAVADLVADPAADRPNTPPSSTNIINTGARIVLDAARLRTLDDVRRYAAVAGPRIAPAGYKARNSTSFRAFRNIAAMLDGIGLYHEALGVIRECNTLAPDPVSEAELMQKWRSIEKYRAAGKLYKHSRIEPARRDGWVKTPSMPCACGCGTLVEQVQGKGRQRKWAPGHKPRKPRAVKTPLTKEERSTRIKEGLARRKAEAAVDRDRISVGGQDAETQEGTAKEHGPHVHEHEAGRPRGDAPDQRDGGPDQGGPKGQGAQRSGDPVAPTERPDAERWTPAQVTPAGETVLSKGSPGDDLRGPHLSP